MAQLVCSTAQIKCSFGVAPSALIVIPSSMVMVNNMPAATIMDFNPMANIPPFGMCMTITNPAVAAATSAALGVFTPRPLYTCHCSLGPWFAYGAYWQ